MQSGSLAALEPQEGQPNGVVIGHELARKIGAFLGDTVEIDDDARARSTPLG